MKPLQLVNVTLFRQILCTLQKSLCGGPCDEEAKLHYTGVLVALETCRQEDESREPEVE